MKLVLQLSVIADIIENQVIVRSVDVIKSEVIKDEKD